MINVAINGYGRIGRNILRAFYERPELNDKMQIVAINDLGSPDMNAHLTQFDTTHGHFHQPVSVEGPDMLVGTDRIRILSERDPSALPWGELSVDIVFECTGLFTERESARKHLSAGAKRVLVSAPGKGMDATVVYGINHTTLTDADVIVSNASCTTNCLAPIAKPLYDSVGIEQGLMTTIHAYTNDQNLSDVYHSDPYRARGSPQHDPYQNGCRSSDRISDAGAKRAARRSRCAGTHIERVARGSHFHRVALNLGR